MFVPFDIVQNSKVMSIVTSMHFEHLFGLRFYQEYKPTRAQFDQAKDFYDEFLAYDDYKPGEEYELVEYFMDSLLVSEDKTLLAATVAKAEKEIMERSEPESFSLYVSVPFCPTRCSYCSFVSHSVKAAAKLIPEYTELLRKELSIFGKIAAELGLKLETVYYGGGTPTTLSPQQLQW